MTGKQTTIWLLTWLAGGILHPFTMGAFLVLVLQPRWKRLRRLTPAVVLVLATMVPSMVRSLVSAEHPLFHVMEAVNFLLILGVILVLFQDSILKKGLAFVLLITVLGAAQLTALLILEGMGGSYQPNFHNWDMFVMVVLTIVLSMILYGIVVLFWNHILEGRSFRKSSALFLLFPISQLMQIWFICHLPMHYQITLGSVGSIVAGVSAEIALFYIAFRQNQEAALKKLLDEVNSAWRVEERNYQSLAERRQYTEKLCHDMNNQLAAISILLQKQNTQEAQKLVDGLKTVILEIPDIHFCENATVNAVITDKKAECDRCGVQLKIQLDLPAQMRVEPIHLCSAFSNLLDNAIRAAGQCEEGRRWVGLKAALVGDYLHVLISNSMTPCETEQKGKKNGYGLLILEDIARLYNGDFEKKAKDGQFTARLTLELEPAEGQLPNPAKEHPANRR